MNIRLAALFTVLTLIFGFLLYQQSFQTIDVKLQDFWLQDERETDYRIAILAIDDESLQDIGQWPWPRAVHAELVNELADVAAVIGFDITFPLAYDNPKDDVAFIDAVENAGNVVLARYGMFDQFSPRGMIESTALADPFSPLKEAARGLGHLNNFPD